MGSVTRPLESVNVNQALLETTVPVSVQLSSSLPFPLSLFLSLSLSLSPTLVAVFMVCAVSQSSLSTGIFVSFHLVSDWSVVFVWFCAVSVFSVS